MSMSVIMVMDHHIFNESRLKKYSSSYLLPFVQNASNAIVSCDLNQKKQIKIEYNRRKKDGESVRLKDLGEWAKSYFGLQKAVPTSTISRIVLGSYSIDENSKKKRIRSVTYPEIESVMSIWVESMWEKGIAISQDLIMQKGKRLRDNVNLLLPAEQEIKLDFSAGWLASFQRRNGFKSRRIHGEAGDVDIERLERELPILQDVIKVSFSPLMVDNKKIDKTFPFSNLIQMTYGTQMRQGFFGNLYLIKP